MKNKVEKVMHEYKEGELHSGSKKGPVVHNRKQAIAIGLSEQRKAKAKAIHAKIGEGKSYHSGKVYKHD